MFEIACFFDGTRRLPTSDSAGRREILPENGGKIALYEV